MSDGSRLKPLGIRAKTTAIALVVVGVSVLAIMGTVVIATRSGLTTQITDTTEARAQDIALLAEEGSVPQPVPGRGEDMLVQVVDSSGAIIASSASIDGQAALVEITLPPGKSKTFTVDSLLEHDGTDEPSGEGGADTGTPFLVAAVGVESPGNGPVTVVVAASLDPIQQLVDLLVPRLAVGLPLIIAIVGLTVWTLTGRALRPVEAIRSQADAITDTSLDRRVPEPGTSDEIGRLAETMNRMLDRLEAASLAQKRFVADASHELKSPIASIRTMIDVAQRAHPVDLGSFLDDLTAEGTRLESLVSDLLALARHEERSAPTHLLETDLDDVVLAEADAIRRSSGIALDLSGVGPVKVHAGAGDLESLVRNLAENAVRHARTCVWIQLGTHGGQAVLTVSDDGPGIAPADRERVFERFVRLDESRGRADGGTGLGLAVCRAIAVSLRGTIQVIEPLHDGATFEVTLPLRPLL